MPVRPIEKRLREKVGRQWHELEALRSVTTSLQKENAGLQADVTRLRSRLRSAEEQRRKEETKPPTKTC